MAEARNAEESYAVYRAYKTEAGNWARNQNEFSAKGMGLAADIARGNVAHFEGNARQIAGDNLAAFERRYAVETAPPEPARKRR